MEKLILKPAKYLERLLISICILWGTIFSTAGVSNAQNLIPNSSFEVVDRHWPSNESFGAIVREGKGIEKDSTIAVPFAVHGKGCIKGTYIASTCFWVPDSEQQYVFSFHMRSDQHTRVQVRVGANPVEPNKPLYLVDVDMYPTREWKRYSFPFLLQGGINDLYYVHILCHQNQPPFWLDAVQLEKGTEPTLYAPVKPVEFGLTTVHQFNAFESDEPVVYNVFEPGKPVVLKVSAYNNETKKFLFKMEVVAKDFYDRIVANNNFEIEVEPNGLTEKEISIPLDIQGSIRIELYQADGLIEDEIAIGIMPPVAIEDRGLGAQNAFEINPIFAKYLGLRYGGGTVCDWDSVQPEGPDKWNWSKSDKIVERCLKEGIKFRAVYLLGVPGWATQKNDKKRLSPVGDFDLEDWEKYVFEVAMRYKGKIDSWTCWNEPWGGGDVGKFIEFLKSTHSALKRANPNAELCGTDVPPVSRVWMDEFIKLSGLEYIDALSSHAYAQIGGYLPEPIAILKKWATHDGKNRPVYNTESTSFPWFNYTFYTHLQPGYTGGWSSPGGQLGFGYPAEEGASRWVKMVITQHSLSVECVMPHYFAKPEILPSLQNRGGRETVDSAWTPFDSAWAVAGRLISTAEGLGQVDSPDLRVSLFKRRDSSVVAAIWTREFEGGQILNAYEAGLFRSPAESAGNRGIVRKILIPQQHDMTIKLDSKIPFTAYDIMGNEVKINQKDGFSVLPVSTDPIYLVARGITSDDFRMSLASAEVQGMGSFDINTSFATGRNGSAGIVSMLLSKRRAKEEVKVILEKSPEGMKFRNTSDSIMLPGARAKEVIFSPYIISTLLYGGSGFKVVAQASDGTKKESSVERLWIVKSMRRNRPLKLDGKFDDWLPREAITLNKSEQVSDNPGAWQGPLDTSARVLSDWDEKNLYFAIEVYDEGKLYPSPGGSGMWSCDSVELFLDLDIMGDLQVTELTDDDMQIHVGPGLSGNEGNAIYYCGNRKLEGFQSAWFKTDKGYNLEILIPWSVFYGPVGHPGIVIGFLPTVCDNDGSQIAWKKISWTGFPDAFHNTFQWGRLVLVDKENEKTGDNPE